MSFKVMIDNLKNDFLYLTNSNIGEKDVKSLADALKDSQVRVLSLDTNNLGCSGLQCLAQVLKDTQITRLALINNNIKGEGIKCLSNVLKDTKITSLDLSNNNIKDEGVTCLISFLKDTQITDLDLSKNKIGIDTAQCLYEVISSSKIKDIYLDIYYTEGQVDGKYINLTSYGGFENPHITLHGNKIGDEGARFLNKIAITIGIAALQLDTEDLEEDDVQYLRQAFNNVKIGHLCMRYCHIIQPNGTQYLVQIFENCQIANLSVYSWVRMNIDVQYLIEFLSKIKLLSLNFGLIRMGDKGMKHLASALRHSDIMYIDLAWNNLETEGAKYLSEILRESKILDINLCNNSIGVQGAKYLADGLSYSQVTDIHLHGNRIEYKGYRYLVDVADNTNLSWVNLHGNSIEAGLKEGESYNPYTIPRKNCGLSSFRNKLRDAFEELVSLNPAINEFEFTIPRSKYTWRTVSVDQYPFLIRTLNDNPNSKAHIFDLMCKNNRREIDCYGLITMNKINEFIAAIQDKFITFIGNKLPDLIKSGDHDFLNLVKQFEDMKLHRIVENLLLHRILYYVDENQEILHPFIYKLLHKYNMLLFNTQLEPNKKAEIISYYQSHQEIDGAQEIIDLLESASFS